MNEYKRLLVLLSALENFEGTKLPINVIKEHIKPLLIYVERRVEEIESERKI